MPDLNTASPENSSRKHEHIWLVLLLISTTVTFSQGIGRELIFDSASIVGADIRLRSVTAENLGNIFTENYWYPTRETDLYRPITTLSLLFNYSVIGNGTSAAGYQVTNLFLHLVCVALAFRLLRRLRIGSGVTVFAVSLFALHPAVTEVVPNIVGRSDLLAALAVFGGLHIYLYWWEGHLGNIPAAIAFFLTGTLGVLSKENAAILPALAIWHLLLFGPGKVCPQKKMADIPKYWRLKEIYVFLCAISGVLLVALSPKILWHVFVGISPNEVLDNPLLAESFINGRLTALDVLGRMIGAIFWPLDLAPDYSFNQIPILKISSFSDPITIIGILWSGLVVGLVVAVFILWCHGRYKGTFALGAGLISFLPTANIIVLVGTIRADRFMYIPTLWIAVGIGLLLSMSLNLQRQPLIRRGIVGSAILLPMLFASLTFFRCTDWIVNRQFWQSAWQSAPNSFKAKLGYGFCLALSGSLEDAEEGKQLIYDAIAIMKKSATPQHPMMLSQIGGGLVHVATVMQEAGQVAEAKQVRSDAIEFLQMSLKEIRHLNKKIADDERKTGLPYFSLRRKGTDVAARQLANAYISDGDKILAHQILVENLEVDRFSPDYLLDLARSDAFLGNWLSAKKRLYQILVLRPSMEKISNLIHSIDSRKIPAQWQEKSVQSQADENEVLLPLDIQMLGVRQSIVEAADVICNDLRLYGRSNEVRVIGRIVRQRIGLENYREPK